VGAVTGLLGLVLGGVIATLAVDWFSISSFEGKAGYFVVGMALVGMVGGALLGVMVARMSTLTGATGMSGFLHALSRAAVAEVALAAIITGISWMQADISPTIGGDTLNVVFEVRWPAGDSTGPGPLAGVGLARLGALSSSHAVRRWGDGAWFFEDARREGDRWIVPGMAPLYTTRGRRLLEVLVGDSTLAAFVLSLPARPGEEDLTWGEWYTGARLGNSLIAQTFEIRTRVVPSARPSRVQQVGPFTVESMVQGLYRVAGADAPAAIANFRLQHRGAPIPGLDSVGAVALLAGEPTALLVRQGAQDDTAPCVMVIDDAAEPRVVPAGECTGHIAGALLPADPERWEAWRKADAPRGWLDRVTFSQPGLYRTDGGVLDTRTRRFIEVARPDEPLAINGLPPIGLSPDEASYVWIASGADGDEPVLAVTNWREKQTEVVAIDRARMRYHDVQQLDPAWLLHHFRWDQAGATWRLVPRTDFVPLPYRGQREIDREGRVSSYYLKPGGTPLRNAMIEALVRELGGTRLPDELDGYHQVVQFPEGRVKGAVVSSGGFVSIGMDFGSVDSSLMARVADTLDRILASGRYDSLFTTDPRSSSP